jgi:hypothetical protein
VIRFQLANVRLTKPSSTPSPGAEYLKSGGVTAVRLNRFPSYAMPSGRTAAAAAACSRAKACTQRSEARGGMRSANPRMPSTSSSSTASVWSPRVVVDLGERQLLAQLVAWIRGTRLRPSAGSRQAQKAASPRATLPQLRRV